MLLLLQVEIKICIDKTKNYLKVNFDGLKDFLQSIYNKKNMNQ